MKLSKAAVLRIARFLYYNVLFALTPLLISIILRYFADLPPSPGVYASELLFFSIVISATASGDVSDETRRIGKDSLFQIMGLVLNFGAVVAAILYGSLMFESLIGPNNPTFRTNINTFAMWFAILFFLVSTTTEIFLAKIEGGSA